MILSMMCVSVLVLSMMAKRNAAASPVAVLVTAGRGRRR